MNVQTKIVLVILSISAIGVSISGYIDGFFENLSFGPLLSLVLPASFLVLVFIVALKSSLLNVGFEWFLVGCALIFVGDSLFLPPQEQVYYLYFAIILCAALLNSGIAWIMVVLIVTAGVTTKLIISEFPDETLDWSQIDTVLLPVVPVFGALWVAGFLPWIFLKKVVLQNKRNEAIEQRRWAESSQLVKQGESNDPEPSQAPKTEFFKLEPSDSSSRGVSELLSSVVYFISRNFKAHSSMAFIYSSEEKVFKLNSFQSKSVCIRNGAMVRAGDGPLGNLGIQKQVFMSGDISLYHSELFYYSQREPVNSILAVPIQSQEGELLGSLVLDSKDKNAFRDQDKELLKRFTKIAAALIINVRMRIFQERAAVTFQIFYEMSHRFTTALKVEEVFEVLTSMVPSITPCARMMTFLYDQSSKKAKLVRVAGEWADEIQPGLEFPLNAGLYSFALLKRRVVKISDMLAYKNKYYLFHPDESVNPQLRSLIIFPIIDDEKRCRGLFSIESSEPDQFSDDIEQVLATMVENTSVAFTRALLYQRMERLATTDGLTGLNNHRNFQELLAIEIERSQRYDRTFSLLLMDIDHFKSFNDTYGHPVGDLVLREIAACIRSSVRLNDIPARYGGEEFAVIIPETSEQGALVIAERIRHSIESHTIISGDNKLQVTISVGCAIFPRDGATQQDLIDAADKALYYSKEHGRNRLTLFKGEMAT